MFFLVKFPVECRQNHIWGPIFVPSYDLFYTNTLYKLRRTHRRAVVAVAVVMAVAVAAVVVAVVAAVAVVTAAAPGGRLNESLPIF